MTLLMESPRTYLHAADTPPVVMMSWWGLPESIGRQSRKPNQPKASGTASSIVAGKRVVIVEDEGLTVWQLRKLLERAGLGVARAGSDRQGGGAVVLTGRP